MLIIMTLTYHWSIFLFDSIDLRREKQVCVSVQQSWQTYSWSMCVKSIKTAFAINWKYYYIAVFSLFSLVL